MSVLFAIALQTAVRSSRPAVDQSLLDGISDACRAPRKWLLLRGREIVFRGDPNGDPVKLECMLRRMSALIETQKVAPAGHAQGSEKK